MYQKLLSFLTIFFLVFSISSFAQDHSHDAHKKEDHNGERYVPGIWIDPDGCEHWVMDDGWWMMDDG